MWLGALLISCWALADPAAAMTSWSQQWMDLSHPYDNTTLHRPGILQFFQFQAFKGEVRGHWLEVNNFLMSQHVGTHMDAPSHVRRGAWSMDDIPVDRFIAHAVMIDISEQSQLDPDYALSAATLQSWLEYLGRFRYPTVVLIHTGNAQHWSSPHRYFYGTAEQHYSKHEEAVGGLRSAGTSERDADGRPDSQRAHGNGTDPARTRRHAVRYRAFHYPGISLLAARLLARDPAVAGVAIDTPSVDPGRVKSPVAQGTLAAANKFTVLNVADMSQVPNMGATVLVVPMKIGSGSGGPCRVLVRDPPFVPPSQPGAVKPSGI